jgi:hypothetical protein
MFVVRKYRGLAPCESKAAATSMLHALCNALRPLVSGATTASGPTSLYGGSVDVVRSCARRTSPSGNDGSPDGVTTPILERALGFVLAWPQ